MKTICLTLLTVTILLLACKKDKDDPRIEFSPTATPNAFVIEGNMPSFDIQTDFTYTENCNGDKFIIQASNDEKFGSILKEGYLISNRPAGENHTGTFPLQSEWYTGKRVYFRIKHATNGKMSGLRYVISASK